MFTPKQISTGCPCVWFAKGDVRRGPQAAIVTQGSDGSGMIDLTVFGKNWGSLLPQSGVRHKDDPFLRDNPGHAIENGCWDYVEGLVYNFEQPKPEPEKPVEQPQVAMDEEAIKDFAVTRRARGWRYSVIAEHLSRLSGQDFTAESVQQLVEKPQEKVVETID